MTTAWGATPPLDITIGPAADSPTTIAIRGLSGASFTIAAVGRTGPGAHIDGAVVFPGAEPHADALFAADAHRFEDLRVLRDAAATSVETYRLELGPALVDVRLVDGRVELLDAQGYVRFASEPAFAVDASGVRRTVTVALEHEAGARVAHASTALDTTGLAFPIVVDPAWTAVTAMKTKRSSHTATALPNGKVLVLGGYDGVSNLSTSEIFDPATSTFSDGPSSTVTRLFHRSTLLTVSSPVQGKVLIFGSATTVSELYDPAAGTLTKTGDFPYAQTEQSLVEELASGKVLAAGGSGSGWNGNTALFDPSTQTWALQPVASAMKYPAGFVRSAKLPSGKVLKVGSYRGGVGWSFAEIYDPATNLWTETAAMADERVAHVVLALPNGKVLAVGSYRHLDGARRTELYDPLTQAWTQGPLTRSGRENSAGIVLSNGRALVVGTQFNGDSRSGEVYDPVANQWSFTSLMAAAREGGHTVTPIGSTGKVLVAGGSGGTGVVSTAEIFQLLPQGAACNGTAPGDCVSGFCVDGVCCNVSCGGSCQACDVATSVGTCTSVASGAPHGTRSCAPFGVCEAGACKSSCATTADCNAQTYCVAAACVPRLANGFTCAAATDCASASCVDGVCCNSTCAGQCEACSVPGKLGTCSPVLGLPIAPRTTCSGVDPGGVCGIGCNGVDRAKCNYPGKSAPCSGNACAAGKESHASLCDGAGQCSDVPKDCGAYACGATACLSACTTDGECSAAFRCSAGACVAREGLGKPCATQSECAAGTFCVDGVCCGSASCATGSACNAPGKAGTCVKSKGTSCASASECGSGFCVDSVCCESSCNGQCQACDVAGSTGTCLPILGAPHGARAKCDDGGSDVCRARACDGKDVATCVAYANGASVTCKPATCAAGKLTPASKCDAAGACVAGEAVSCAPFACEGASCLSTCATYRDCAAGNTCTAGRCVPGASCSDDRRSSIGQDGTPLGCDAYLCDPATGTCRATCADSRDCAGGFVCDPGQARCVSAITAGDEGGGCSTSPRSSTSRPSPKPWWLAAMLAPVLRRRRTREIGRRPGTDGTTATSSWPHDTTHLAASAPRPEQDRARRA